MHLVFCLDHQACLLYYQILFDLSEKSLYKPACICNFTDINAIPMESIQTSKSLKPFFPIIIPHHMHIRQLSFRTWNLLPIAHRPLSTASIIPSICPKRISIFNSTSITCMFCLEIYQHFLLYYLLILQIMLSLL
jgi:hypothetical protein